MSYIPDIPWEELPRALNRCLKRAMEECSGELEEEGGVIVEKDGEYQFIYLRNLHADTPAAICLFEGNREDYGEKVIPRFIDKFKNYASFHTHPTNCAAWPSATDLGKLFKGFPINFIWSPSLKELNKFEFSSKDKDQYFWTAAAIDLEELEKSVRP